MSKNNANLNPSISVRNPYKGGITAPPTIAVQSNPEACAFKSPNPSSVNVKIVGNMMELNNPTDKIDHSATSPFVFIEINMSSIESDAKIPKTFAGANILVR